MAKETVLIIGLGEIGHTLFALYSEELKKVLSLRFRFRPRKNECTEPKQRQSSKQS